MNYPNDIIYSSKIVASAGTYNLVPTSTDPFSVMFYRLDKQAQNAQMIQCKTDDDIYTTFAQAIGTDPQFSDPYKVFPSGSVCYLRTFDGTLTQGQIGYVAYDISEVTATTSTTTIPQYTQGDFFTQFLLICIILMIAFGGIYKAIFGAKVRTQYYNASN